jgi:26S proteasome regulatory subunit N2
VAHCANELQCFYHLEEYNDSLRLALAAGGYFDISEKSEYVDTLLSKCIDEYTELRRRQDARDETAIIDPRMEHIVQQMFVRCYRDRTHKQAMGIALESRRLDKVEEVILDSPIKEEILEYTFQLCQQAVGSREFRLTVLGILVKLYGSVRGKPDFSNVCQCLQHLNRPADVAAILEILVRGTLTEALLAYQIAFNVVESENQGFVLEVVKHSPALQTDAADEHKTADEKDFTPMETDAPGVQSSSYHWSVAAVASEEEVKERVGRLRQILIEGFDVDLVLNFLFRQTNTDVTILSNIKAALESRNSILHNSTVVAHGYMNAGTTIDVFLRDNLDWLGKASNWAKFTAVASIGVVHKGHVHESMNLLEPYLPQG